MSDEGFLARWSRRKAGVASPGDQRPEAPSIGSPAPTIEPAAPVAPASVARPAANPAERADDEALRAPVEPPPTLADVAALTRESDYTRFMAPGVDGAVRNAAMRKLFADPHFNVMDGLDVYIDDYGKPDPLPASMLRQLRQSELLGLFAEDPADAPAADRRAADADHDNRDAPAAAPASTTPAATCSPEPCDRAEDDPDLRLQPDDGDRRPGAGEGARD